MPKCEPSTIKISRSSYLEIYCEIVSFYKHKCRLNFANKCRGNVQKQEEDLPLSFTFSLVGLLWLLFSFSLYDYIPVADLLIWQTCCVLNLNVACWSLCDDKRISVWRRSSVMVERKDERVRFSVENTLSNCATDCA